MRHQVIWIALLTATAWANAAPPAPTAGEGDHAILLFRITDTERNLIPARLTFWSDTPRKPLFPNTQADPENLAVRDYVVYTRTGQGSITVPEGNYEIMASRGLEYGIKRLPIRLTAGKTTFFEAELQRQVDTTGWVGGDFHLHTLTHSGHGDANMNERIISLIGEGVEFAVATDHNHNIDYEPTIAKLDVQEEMRAVVGNEVSTPIGHFNAFPLDAERPIPPADATDAHKLFKLIRGETNKFGVVPVIQLNHPRWGGIDYFTKVDLDPVTGEGGPGLSTNFDTIELLNENAGWGYYDAERRDDREYGSSRYSVLQDWFNLLNRGHKVAAVGNSDSHTVRSNIAGVPRNYVKSSSDVPSEINPGEMAKNLRDMQVFTTTGPFVTYTVTEQRGSGTGHLSLDVTVEIQAADWVQVETAKLIMNGDIVDQKPVRLANNKATIVLKTNVGLSDCWITVIVEGTEPLPIPSLAKRATLPLAVCNPTFVSALLFGQGAAPWKSPLSQVQEALRAPQISAQASRTPTEFGLLVLEAARANHTAAAELVSAGLSRPERRSLLYTCRAIELIPGPGFAQPLLKRLGEVPSDDPYLRIALLRALQKCDPDVGERYVDQWIENASRDELSRYGGELLSDRATTIVRDWQVVGYFDNPSRATLVGVTYEPERNPEAEHYNGKDDAVVQWQQVGTREDGFLDLGALRGDAENAISYARCYVRSDAARKVTYAVGTDDGGRMWLNRALVHEDTGRHGATPFQHVGALQLKEGWNEILLKVENGGGPTGAYLRFFDQVEVTPTKK